MFYGIEVCELLWGANVVTSLELADRVARVLDMNAATVVQHLRNLQKDDRISFKGHGRGAARMGPRDAANLLLAAVGSDLVKDSLRTVDTFGSLRPIRTHRPPSGVTFLDHLTGFLSATAASGSRGEVGIAFRLISAGVGTAVSPPLRFAIAAPVAGARDVVSFAPAGWDMPLVSETAIVTALRGTAGFLKVGMVTIEALEKLAESI